MIDDHHDVNQAIRPYNTTDINGLGSSKRQRTSEEGEADRAEEVVGDQQHPQYTQGEPVPGQAPAEEEIQEEALPARAALRPEQPTAAERAAHDLTHCPYRSWCRACMLGRGRDRSHHRIDHRGDIIPRVALDYMFFTDYGITKTLEEAHELIEKHQGDIREVQPTLVMKDYARGSVWAYPVDGKGMAAAPFIAEMILSDLDSCGLGSAQLVSKTDQEPGLSKYKVRSASYDVR